MGNPNRFAWGVLQNSTSTTNFCCQCMRSDSYFESYIRAFKLKEQAEQSLLNELSGEWTASSTEHQEQSDGLLVLNKFDQPLSESIQDLVVVVELKYKDGAQESNSVTEHEGLEPPVESLGETNMPSNNEHSGSDRFGNFLEVQRDESTKQGHHVDKSSAYFRYDDATKEYECALCEKKFKRRSRLSCHLTRHTGIKPHACEKCEKSFGTMCELNIHSRIHKRDIVCNHCDKAFTTNSKLERHFRVHTGEKPFFCTYCGKNFGDKRNLENHIRTHTGVKPYSCSVCEKTFSVKSHMVEHLNVHKKSASFHCATCSKVFRWRSNYKKHIKTHS
uniref:C2H2-type domain-containing protein n=1 Tax=Lygus hesperus TaxID=30085 RepID=A0A0A9WJ28_LYGHE